MIKGIISIIAVVNLIVGMPFSNLSRDIEAGIFLVKNEESKSNKKPFIEETKEGQDINDYERELYRKFIEESAIVETTERKESSVTKEIANRIESIVAEKIDKRKGKSTSESELNQKVVINAKHDRYEIYIGKNDGIVEVSDDKNVYYKNKANVKVIRDMLDEYDSLYYLCFYEGVAGDYYQ